MIITKKYKTFKSDKEMCKWFSNIKNIQRFVKKYPSSDFMITICLEKRTIDISDLTFYTKPKKPLSSAETESEIKPELYKIEQY